MIRHELMKMAKEGDEVAMKKLLIDWQPKLEKIAFKKCNINDVDDAIQESLTIIWKRIGTLKTVEAFPGWVMTIIKRECAKLLKPTPKNGCVYRRLPSTFLLLLR